MNGGQERNNKRMRESDELRGRKLEGRNIKW